MWFGGQVEPQSMVDRRQAHAAMRTAATDLPPRFARLAIEQLDWDLGNNALADRTRMVELTAEVFDMAELRRKAA